MFKKKLPSCASISVINPITVPTVLCTVLTIALKIPDIIKTANEIMKTVPAIKKMVNDMNNQLQEEQVIESKGGEN